MDPLSWGVRPLVDPSTYQTDPNGDERKEIRARISAYILSQEYKDRVKRIIAANLTGVIIPAGGVRYTTNLLVTLKVRLIHMLIDHLFKHVKSRVQDWDSGTRLNSIIH